MEQSPPWEDNSHLPSQEIHRLSRKPTVHYRVHNSQPLFVTVRNKLDFLVDELLAPRPTPKPEEHPFTGCRRLLNQYIRSYPQYPEAVPSIRNPRMRYALLTGTHTTQWELNFKLMKRVAILILF
jgi:hypothetical protein